MFHIHANDSTEWPETKLCFSTWQTFESFLSAKLSVCKMTCSEHHIRHCMLYEFNSGKDATTATENICAAYGEDALTVRTCRRWFTKFRCGDTSLEDKPRLGRPVEIDDDALLSLVGADPRLTTRELAETQGSSHVTIITHVHQLGKVSKMVSGYLINCHLPTCNNDSTSVNHFFCDSTKTLSLSGL